MQRCGVRDRPKRSSPDTNTPQGSEAEARFLAAVPRSSVREALGDRAAAELLLSEDAGFITGQTLYVDGGASLEGDGLNRWSAIYQFRTRSALEARGSATPAGP